MFKSKSLFSKVAVALGLAILPTAALAETYDVAVKTGKAKWAGTNANVWVTLYAVRPASHTPIDSGAIQLTDRGANDFSAGSTRHFRITTPGDIALKHIYGLKVEEDKIGPEPDWYLESIEVKDVEKGDTKTFLCNCWLSKETGYSRYIKPFVHF